MVPIRDISRNLWLVAATTLLTILPNVAVSKDQKLTYSIEGGVEYDDNISVPILDTVTGKSDESLVFDLSGSYMAMEKGAKSLELNYDFYQSLHTTYNEYNLQIHTLSALGSWEMDSTDIGLSEWDFAPLDAGLSYSYTTTILSTSRLNAFFTVTPSVGFSGFQNFYHQLSYGLLDKNFLSKTERDATQHSIRSDNYYFFMQNRAYVSFGLRLESENTIDPELDYQGTYLKLGTSIPLPYYELNLKLKANYQRYWRNYSNINESIAQRRKDKRDLIRIELIKPVKRDIDVKFSYERTNTDSNLPSADSAGNNITITLSKDFN